MRMRIMHYGNNWQTLEAAPLFPYSFPTQYRFQNSDWHGIESLPTLAVRHQRSKLAHAHEEAEAPTLRFGANSFSVSCKHSSRF